MVVESLNDQDRTQKHLKPYQTKKVKGNRKGRTWFFPGLVSDAEHLESHGLNLANPSLRVKQKTKQNNFTSTFSYGGFQPLARTFP